MPCWRLRISTPIALAPRLTDRRIPPGGQGRITLTIAPYSVLRQFTKKTKVFFNDPDHSQVVLTLQGYEPNARPMPRLTWSIVRTFTEPWVFLPLGLMPKYKVLPILLPK